MIRREYGWGMGILLAVALVSCFSLPRSWAADPKGEALLTQEVGKIERTQGATMVRRAGETEFGLLTSGDPVFVQDTIGTDPTDKNAKIWWRHPAPAKMDASLGPDSLLGFVAYGEEGPVSSFVGAVSKGMVRFIRKLPATDPASSFTIMTPTALVQVVPADRAADYVVSVIDDNHTAVTVIWGVVVVKNVSDQLTQERQLTSCQMVIVEKDKDPSEVMGVGSDTLRELIQLTTIPHTLPTDVPSCEPPAQPVPPEEYIPPEFPEVIEGYPGEEYGPPGFIPVPVPFPPHTWDTTDTTDTTITETTGTLDTTPTIFTPITLITPITTIDTTNTLLTLITPLTFDTINTMYTIPTLLTLDTINTIPTGLTFNTLFTLPTIYTFDTAITQIPTVLTLDTFMTLNTLVTFDTSNTQIPTLITFNTIYTSIPTFFTQGPIDTTYTGPIGPVTLDTTTTVPTVSTLTTIPTVSTATTLSTSISTVYTGYPTFSTGGGTSGTGQPFIQTFHTYSTGGGVSTMHTFQTFSTGKGEGNTGRRYYRPKSKGESGQNLMQEFNKQNQEQPQMQKHEFHRR